jgi:16S rRNA (adenine1518-N6/adenine1519-N6)-dimethyltransferase
MGAETKLVKFNEPGAKKRLGQHFLRDKGVIDRIIRWIHPVASDVFWDIGAGDGALSLRLAPLVAGLTAIEIDQDRIPGLNHALADIPSARVIAGDFLQLELLQLAGRLPRGQKLRIAGNLPYNVATAILGRLLHSSLPIEDMFFMVQLEVAQRVAAHPATRQYGFLSVICQHLSEVRMGFKVSPACFVPRPQVTSATISIRPKGIPPGSQYEADFESLCKAAFAYRRKILSNSLSKHPVFGKISNELLARADIDGSRRAEELSVDEFEHLARVFVDSR